MSEHTLGDAPIQDEYREKMQTLARSLDVWFNGEDHGQERKTGFVLLVFPFGDDFDGRCNYISNGADRKEIVVLFKEQIKRFEGMAEPTPGHG
jgi:hypothetical protein